MERVDLGEVQRLVRDVGPGWSDPRVVHRLVRKEIRRAKSRLDTDREIRLRLMMGDLEFYGLHHARVRKPYRSRHKLRATRQYRAVLRKQPESAEAMMGMALIASMRRDRAGALQWLETARQISERLGDCANQLSALDQMLWSDELPVDTAWVLAQMRELWAPCLDVCRSTTIGIDCLLAKRRGRETVDCLEQLIRSIPGRTGTYGYLLMCLRPIIIAYSQCGLTAAEARAKIRHLCEPRADENTGEQLDRAFERVFKPFSYVPAPEYYGVTREWLRGE